MMAVAFTDTLPLDVESIKLTPSTHSFAASLCVMLNVCAPATEGLNTARYLTAYLQVHQTIMLAVRGAKLQGKTYTSSARSSVGSPVGAVLLMAIDLRASSEYTGAFMSALL